MKFFVPWNRDARGVSLGGREEVGGIYGDFAEGPPFDLKADLSLSHLFDGLCFNNQEFTRPGQKRMRFVFDRLTGAGIGSVVVAHPYFALWLRKNYPRMRLTVSSAAGVDSVLRARWWEDLGVETITLPDVLANRDPEFIRLIRRSVRCRLQLFANSGCRSGCPWRFYSCWGSKTECGYGLFSGREACFIRPGEVGSFEELGIDSLQIGDERMPPDFVLKTLEAYVSRSQAVDPGGLLCGSLRDAAARRRGSGRPGFFPESR